MFANGIISIVHGRTSNEGQGDGGTYACGDVDVYKFPNDGLFKRETFSTTFNMYMNTFNLINAFAWWWKDIAATLTCL